MGSRLNATLIYFSIFLAEFLIFKTLAIYVCLLQGNRVSVKQVGTKSIDLTKGILLELTQVSMKNHGCFYSFSGRRTHESKSAAILRLFLSLKVHSRHICAGAIFSRSQGSCLFRVDKML